MRCGREHVVVRREPLQLTGSLENLRDRPDPLQVLALLAKRIIDLVHVLDHRTGLLSSPSPLRNHDGMRSLLKPGKPYLRSATTSSSPARRSSVSAPGSAIDAVSVLMPIQHSPSWEIRVI